jgi:hypothetical protein
MDVRRIVRCPACGWARLVRAAQGGSSLACLVALEVRARHVRKSMLSPVTGRHVGASRLCLRLACPKRRDASGRISLSGGMVQRVMKQVGMSPGDESNGLESACLRGSTEWRWSRPVVTTGVGMHTALPVQQALEGVT